MTEMDPVPSKPPPKAPPSAPAAPAFKPIQNWHKIMKVSSEKPLSKSMVDQIFKNVLTPYVPCVPKNTSERLINALSDSELEQLCCPGCKDRFLLPTSFFQVTLPGLLNYIIF